MDKQSTKPSTRRRPIPGISESEERLLAMVTALTGQLTVTRERVDTLERVLARAGVISRTDIEDFDAAEGEVAERDALRRGVIAKVFRPLQDAAERDLQLAQSGTPGGSLQIDSDAPDTTSTNISAQTSTQTSSQTSNGKGVA